MMAMVASANGAAILKRQARPWPTRYAAFVSLAHGMLHENGMAYRWDEGSSGDLQAPLDFLLDLATGDDWNGQPCQVLYIVGGWNAASMPATEWFIAPEGWTRTTYHRDPLIAIYKRQADGRKLTLYSTAQWFGECESAGVCRRAYIRLRELLRSTFDPGADLLGTPARTGLDLLARSLPRNLQGTPYEYPVLDVEFREMIEHNIGQGRVEFLPPIGGAARATDHLYMLDANWMYAACIRHLPAPPLEHDQGDEYAGYRCGFYRVEFAVPYLWQHIGLLPTWDSQARKTVYPCTFSERWYPAIVSGEELRLAYGNGWHVKILERWLFAPDRAANADPTRAWAEHLRMLRGACTDRREGQAGPLLRAAIRSLTIKAIGGLSRKGRAEQVETPHDQAETVDPSMVLEITPTVIRWMRPIPLAPEMAGFNHPEWAAMVWCRARARLARAALKLPRESIIALRNDAIVTTFDPGWQDDGRPGTFRTKGRIDLAGAGVPQDERTYRRLLRGLKDA
jgi:hypothetical protein